MKKTKILISYNAEKISAIEDYADKKGVNLMAEIDETISRVYEKCVPAPVREFIDSKQKKEAEAKLKAAEKSCIPSMTDTAPREDES